MWLQKSRILPVVLSACISTLALWACAAPQKSRAAFANPSVMHQESTKHAPSGNRASSRRGLVRRPADESKPKTVDAIPPSELPRDAELGKFRPRELDAATRADIEALAKTCESAENEKERLNACFMHARRYFDAQHWQEAAAGFHELAFRYSSTEDGGHAVLLYLECLNVLLSRSPDEKVRADAVAAFRDDVPRLRELHCPIRSQWEICDNLTAFSVDLRRLHAENLRRQGMRERSRDAVLSAGLEMEQLYQEFCGSDSARFACGHFAREAVEAYLIANRVDLARKLATTVLAPNSPTRDRQEARGIACLFEGTNLPSAEAFLRKAWHRPRELPCTPEALYIENVKREAAEMEITLAVRAQWARDLRERPDTSDESAESLARSLSRADDPALRTEVLAWARARCRKRLEDCFITRLAAWRALEILGELRGGMTPAQAEHLLGPAQRDGSGLLFWRGNADKCRGLVMLQVRVGRTGLVEDVEFDRQTRNPDDHSRTCEPHQNSRP